MTSARIVFLCASVEAGRDGVGDYTVRLATELVRSGTPTAVVALTDQWVTATAATVRDRGADELSVLRVPPSGGATSVGPEVAGFVDEADPEWLSLQFVSWSHGGRGIVRDLARQLAPLGHGRRWHVMCHELWIERSENPWRFLLGRIQRRRLLAFLRDLNPHVIHVSTTRNQAMLRRNGLDAAVLPIPGSVAVVEQRGAVVGTDRLRLLIFGTPPPSRQMRRVARRIASYSSGCPVTIVLAGGSDASRATTRSIIERGTRTADVRVEDRGFVDEEELSRLMSSSHVGLARGHERYYGKSSVLATMLDHGLPVWAPAWRGGPTGLGERACLLGGDIAMAATIPRGSARPLLPTVAAQFSVDLDL